MSSAAYYTPLAHQLDKLPDVRNCRVEVVDHGAHAGYAVLLDHVLLARGWETQENGELNGALDKTSLDATTYKVWLDNNAVCYVALPGESVASNPEYDLVAAGTVPFLQPIWQGKDWQLYRVGDPTHIVPAPASVVSYSQASMTIDVPCTCTINLRIRWSHYLTARLERPGSGTSTAPAVLAKLADDGSGWTTITTTKSGHYVLSGSLTGGLLP